MSYWLDLSAPLKAPPGAAPSRTHVIGDPGGARASVGTAGDVALAEKPAAGSETRPDTHGESYWHLVAVGGEVADRVSRCFAGPAWLRRRFPARSHVQLYVSTTEDPTPGVEYLRTEIGPDGEDGPHGIYCGLRIPASWTAAPGDGLLGLRLLQAVLLALHAIGARYDIGMPAAVRPTADPGVRDPFGPPPPPQSYTAINEHLHHLAATLRPDQLLLAAKDPAGARGYRHVCEALGAVIDQHPLTAPDVKATAWTIQTPS